ncbi:hypothetical protein [Streptomyces smyrnaeus]|uniref:hypothetical protein n=1 Tax=Streptomyces smyrnaeus TaxID=1387713 RepID=UPI003688FB28
MTVVTTVVSALFLGGWGWITDQFSGPPGLKAHAEGVEGCGYSYFKNSHAKSGESEGVSIPTPDMPAELFVTVQAKTSQAIVITDAKVSVLSRKPLPKRGFIKPPPGCGGGMTLRPFEVNLKDPASVRPLTERTGQGKVKKGRDFPFKVSSSDPEQFVFQVKRVRQDVRFELTLNWVSEGETGTTRFDNGGRGYRVMGFPDGLPRRSQ